MECSRCQKKDFASSLRCQWCGTPLRETVAALAPSPSLGAAFNGASAPPLTPAFATHRAPMTNAVGAGDAATTPLSNGRELDAPQKGDWKKRIGGLGGALALLLSKLKLLLGALKFGKLATMFGSMFVSIGFYALMFGWAFAAGFVLLIFVHEMGHVIALKRRGIPIEGMFFIPFLGAAVSFKKRPRDPAVDAEISWAGPLAGGLGGAVCFAVYMATGEIYWLVLAHVTFLLNLINLSPSLPLDGGWIVKAINPKLGLVGSVIGVGIGLYLHSTLLAIIAGLGAIRAYSSWKSQDDDLDMDVPAVTSATRLRITVAYVGLMLVLGAALGYSTHVLHEDRAARDNGAQNQMRAGNALAPRRGGEI